MPVRKKIAGLDYRAAGIAGAAGLGPGVGGSRGDCGCVGATVAPTAFAAASVVDFTSPGLWTLGVASVVDKKHCEQAYGCDRRSDYDGPRPFPFELSASKQAILTIGRRNDLVAHAL
jgi:hypothetical protein